MSSRLDPDKARHLVGSDLNSICLLMLSADDTIGKELTFSFPNINNILSRQRGRRLEPHGRHCVVALEQDTFILA